MHPGYPPRCRLGRRSVTGQSRRSVPRWGRRWPGAARTQITPICTP